MNISIALIVLTLLPSALFAQVTQHLKVDDQGAVLNFVFPSPLEVNQRTVGGNIVLQFNQPLKGSDVTSAAKPLAKWVDSMWNGYDSLLIKPKPGNNFTTQIADNRLLLVFSDNANTPTPANSQPNNTDRRLRLLSARLDQKEGNTQQAEQTLNQLVRENPKGVEERVALAEVNLQQGRRRQAVEHYRTAVALKPNDQSLRRTGAQVLTDYASYADIRGYHQTVGNTETQNVVIAKGRLALESGHAFEVRHQVTDLDQKTAVTRLDGSSGPFNGQRNHIAVRYIDETGEFGKGHLLATHNTKTLGLGMYRQMPHQGGQTWVRGAWHEPWNGLSSAIIDYGHRDQVAAGHEREISPKLYLSTGAAYNRYGLDGLNDAARSWQAQFAMRYQLAADNAEVDVGYNVEKEEASDHAVLTDNNAANFKPLDISSTEIHNIDLSWSSKFGQNFKFNSQLGYGVDRLNGEGPFANLSLIYQPEWYLEAGVDASYSSATSTASDGDTQRIGAYIKARFQ